MVFYGCYIVSQTLESMSSNVVIFFLLEIAVSVNLQHNGFILDKIVSKILKKYNAYLI